MVTLAPGFWPWFWTLTIAGAALTALLTLAAGVLAQRRSGHRAHSAPLFQTPARARGDAPTIPPPTPVSPGARTLARR